MIQVPASLWWHLKRGEQRILWNDRTIRWRDMLVWLESPRISVTKGDIDLPEIWKRRWGKYGKVGGQLTV